MATIPLPMGIPRQLAVSADGRTAFMAHDEGWNVVAVDVSDPRRPRLAGVGATGGFCSSVAAWGEGVAACDSRRALHVLDFRPGPDPFRALVPRHVRELPRPRQVLAVGRTLVVGTAEGVAVGGRWIRDLGEPLAAWSAGGRLQVGGARGERWVILEVPAQGAPREMASLPGGVVSADSDGRWLGLVRGREVAVLDLAGGRPRALGAFTAPAAVGRIRVRGGLGYLSGAALCVVDLPSGRLRARREALPNAGTYATRIPAFEDALPCAGGFVAAVDRFWGVRVLRGDTLEEVGDLPTSGGDFTGLQVDGSRLYVGNNWGGVAILDLAQPDRPRVVGGTRRALSPNPGCAGFLAAGARLWSQGNEDRTLRAFDVSDPARPRVLAQLPMVRPGRPGDVRRFGAGYPALWGDLLVLPGEARVVDAGTLRVLGAAPEAGFDHDAVAVATLRGRPHAVLTGEDGLAVVDLGDPRHPRRLGFLAGDHGAYYFARALQVEGERAYLANRKALQVVDLRDPARPRLEASLVLEGEPVDVRVAGGIAWVAAYYGGIHAVDVRDPSRPRRLATFRQPAAPEQSANAPCYQAVEVARGQVYAAEYYSGVQVLDPGGLREGEGVLRIISGRGDAVGQPVSLITRVTRSVGTATGSISRKSLRPPGRVPGARAVVLAAKWAGH